MWREQLYEWLERNYARYNQPHFIDNDPIQIPHRFKRLQDVEIAAFITATLAWGQRKTIIDNCSQWLLMMDNAPYDFVLNHQESDLKPIAQFKHRTFNGTDALYFIYFLANHYRQHASLETAFAQHLQPHDQHIGSALIGFHQLFFSLDAAPLRTHKHVATPQKNATCKRLNMFLRWMVRRDQHGVDFGLWQQIKPAQLLIPLDVHVERVARHVGLLQRSKTDWKAVLELSEQLKQFDPQDPIKYDFALFGYGVNGANWKG